MLVILATPPTSGLVKADDLHNVHNALTSLRDRLAANAASG